MSNDPERDARIPLSVGTRGAGASMQSSDEAIVDSLMRQIAALDPSTRERLVNWTAQFVGPIAQSPIARDLRAYEAKQAHSMAPAEVGLNLRNVDDAFAVPLFDDRDAMVHEALIAAAKVILRTVPPCPDRSDALRDLRRVRWATHGAIVGNGRF